MRDVTYPELQNIHMTARVLTACNKSCEDENHDAQIVTVTCCDLQRH